MNDISLGRDSQVLALRIKFFPMAEIAAKIIPEFLCNAHSFIMLAVQKACVSLTVISIPSHVACYNDR